MIWSDDDAYEPRSPPVGRCNVAPCSPRIKIPAIPLSLAGDHVKILIGPYRGRTGSVLCIIGGEDDTARVQLDDGETATIPRAALFPHPVPGAVSALAEDRKVA